MEIKFRKNPTYIHKDGGVEFKCYVDGNPQRIWLDSLAEYMDLLYDQLNALRHHVTGITREKKRRRLI